MSLRPEPQAAAGGPVGHNGHAMPKFSLSHARAHLSELVQRAMLGEEVVIAEGNKPVVRLVPVKPPRRKPGTGKGIWMSPDFDEPLDDFRKYT